MTGRYRHTAQVNFLEYRVLESRVVDASNAIWAILAGSQIAANTLRLTEGSTRTLAEIFPTVSHINRFNLRTDVAHGLLQDAEHHLCTMGVSYAISLHEDFIKSSMAMVEPYGLITAQQIRDSSTATMHETLARVTGGVMDGEALFLFHMVRLIRNCHIHSGGMASKALENHMSKANDHQREAWVGLTKHDYEVVPEGGNISIGLGELIGTLAVNKRLAYDANLCLQKGIPRDAWASKAVSEYFQENPAVRPNNPTAIRSVSGYAKLRFAPVALTRQELEVALQSFKNA